MKYAYCILFIILFLFSSGTTHAQGMLDKRVSVAAKNKTTKYTLDLLEKQCACSFSYNSELIHGDSMVNITAANKTIKQVLQMMFGDRFQYKSVDDHIVIVQAEKEKWFTISGYVHDAITGIPIADVSIFERQQLASVLTNADGSFKLRIKDKGRYALAEITCSKGGFYTDTTINLQPGFDEELTIALSPASHTLPDIQITPYASVERSWFGRHFFSSSLRKQSANLGKFFVDKPVQASFLPGIGSHGKLSGQVTNKFSFNALGGYAAGVDGFEVGGLFNIDKKDVRYAQVGGIMNIVSGNVTGVQIGGITNKVGKTMSGAQISGITSLVNNNINGVIIAGICSRSGGSMKGLQISGISNILDHSDTTTVRSKDSSFTMKGMQLAGIANIVNGNSCGFQLAGVANISRGDMKGLQMSGMVNITRKLEGSQIGLINIADTVTGYSIGLINIVKHGYHALCIYSNELTTANIAYKTGTKHLYSILAAGANTAGTNYVVYGPGIGSERKLSRKTGVSGELYALNMYDSKDDVNALLIRAEPTFNWNISRRFSLYTGPSVCFMPYRFSTAVTMHRFDVPSPAVYNFRTGSGTATWIGWQVGFHIF